MERRITMRKLKRILIFAAFVAALTCLLCMALNAETYSGTCGAEGDGSNLTWTLDTETGVLKIEGKGAMAEFGSAGTTPWGAYRTMITSVEISEGVTSLGKYSIYGFSNLTNLVIPSTVTTIKAQTISSAKLTSLVIPEGVKNIEQNAICYSGNLSEVVIPESMEKMAGLSFRSCNNLKKIFIFSKNVEIAGNLNWSAYTVYGYTGSTAEEHATKVNKKFVPLNGTCGAEGDNLTWTLDANGLLKISGAGDMANFTTSNTPWREYRLMIKAVEMDDGVTSVGHNALLCL